MFRRLRKKHPFLDGIARVLDIGGTFDEVPKEQITPTEADYRAIMGDWQVVGQDLWKAIKDHEPEYLEALEKQHGKE